MPDMLTTQGNGGAANAASTCASPLNMAERELLRFIDSMSDLFGPEQSKFLTEIWMDALASMECMPAPSSPDWRQVTVVASVRLAARVLEIPDRFALV